MPIEVGKKTGLANELTLTLWIVGSKPDPTDPGINGWCMNVEDVKFDNNIYSFEECVAAQYQQMTANEVLTALQSFQAWRST